MGDPRFRSIRPDATDDEQKAAYLQVLKARHGLKLRPAWPAAKGLHRQIVMERIRPVARVEDAGEAERAA